MTYSNLTNCSGENSEINEYLKKYEEGKFHEVSNWLWDELYHQGDIGTASVAWIIEAHEIFLKANEIDWNYLAFTYAVMRSLEELIFIECPKWANDKYRPIAIKSLKHALSNLPDKLNEEQQLSLLSLTCAITKNYDSYELIEYGWKYEEQLMDIDFDK
jgi:hypothetical protein